MTKKKYEDLTNVAIGSIKEANLSSDDEAQLITLVENARIATNGLSPDEKIQTMSENQFSMVLLMVETILDLRKQTAVTPSWKDVLVRCRSEIMWVLFGVIILLLFRPHIADGLTALATGAGG